MGKIIKKIELITLLTPILIVFGLYVLDLNTIFKDIIAFVLLVSTYFIGTFLDEFFRNIENDQKDLSDETDEVKDLKTISYAIRFISLLNFFIVVMTIFSERIKDTNIKLGVAGCVVALAALQYFFTVRLIKKTEKNQ